MFSFLDLFPQTVNLYYRGAFKQSSGMGILFSLGIYGLIIFSFIQSDMYAKKSPIVVSQSLQTEVTRKIQFDKNRIIAFSVKDFTKKAYMDPSIFDFKLRYFRNASYFEYKEFKPCSLEDAAFNTSLFAILDMNNSFCLKNKNFDLDGSLDETHLSYIAVSLFLCSNSTSNVTCKSQEEIDAYFNNWSAFKFISVSYHNSQTNLSDYENPFKLMTRTDYQFIDTSIKKRIIINLKTSDVYTDDGWIFPSEKVQSDIMFDSKEFDFQMRSDKTQPVFQILFFASKEVVKSTRRYQKLPEILGSIAGTIQFIMIFCTILTKLATYVSTLNYITNKLYFFEESKFKNNEKNQSMINSILKSKSEIEIGFPKNLVSPMKDPPLSSKDPPLFNKKDSPLSNKDFLIKSSNAQISKILKQDSFILEHFSEEIEIHKTKKDGMMTTQKNTIKRSDGMNFNEKRTKVSHLKLFRKKKKIIDLMKTDKNPKNNFAMSYFEYIWFKLVQLIFKKTPKQQLIYKAEKAFKNDMDIVNIVTKLHDLEKLKILLLDEDQLVLFKYLTKPIITPDNDKNIFNERLNTPQTKMSSLISAQAKEGKHIEESYKKVLCYQASNTINKRMIELLDANFCGCANK